jgi:hypothetical protein
MIKLIDLLKEENILIPRRSKEERSKNHVIAAQKQIQQYIKNGGKGDLYLGNIEITSLNGLKVVGGNLDLGNTLITSLPDNLKVEGSLLLGGTKITSLPDGLEVGEELDLNNTLITSLPNDLKVGRYLNLNNTPISKKYTKEKYTKEKIKQMVPGVIGGIYL